MYIFNSDGMAVTTALPPPPATTTTQKTYKERREGICRVNLLESECKQLAQSIGKRFYTETAIYYPVGCFEYYTGTVYFNNASSYYHCGRSYVTRCFCKLGEDIEILNSHLKTGYGHAEPFS